MDITGEEFEKSQQWAATVATPATVERTWLVLTCQSGKTLALMRRLNDEHIADDRMRNPRGAWTPIWKRRKRYPRSTKHRLVDLPAMPSFVFVPMDRADDLPVVPGISYRPMLFGDRYVVVPDRQLAPLRKIDTQPQDPQVEIPKPGEKMRFGSGPFEGLNCKVVYANRRYAKVLVEGFTQPLQVPPSLLQKIGL